LVVHSAGGNETQSRGGCSSGKGMRYIKSSIGLSWDTCWFVNDY
jgi:hypothetical protein